MNPLQALRDIHLPPPVSWWPPALGWWLTAGLLLLGIVFGGWIYRYYRRRAFKRQAWRELRRIQQHYQQTQNTAQLASELSILLRRTALAVYPQAAGLRGAEWLAFLDRSGKTQAFSQGVGQVLCHAPYQPNPQFTAGDLLNLIQQWLRRQ